MEYRITATPSTLVNPTFNAILEWMHQVLRNLENTCNITQTFGDKDDPWSVILSTSAFEILSTTNGLKGYSPGKLVFGSDIILLIKNKMDWELIRRKKQTKMNKNNIHEDRN